MDFNKMAHMTFETIVSSSVEEVAKGFNQELFEALKPPLLTLKVKKFDGCVTGDEVHLEVGLGITMSWVSKITSHIDTPEEWSFVDEGETLPPPLKNWHHHHRVIKRGDQAAIIDDIHFSTGLGLLDKLIYPLLFLQFKMRGPVYKKFFN